MLLAIVERIAFLYTVTGRMRQWLLIAFITSPRQLCHHGVLLKLRMTQSTGLQSIGTIVLKVAQDLAYIQKVASVTIRYIFLQALSDILSFSNVQNAEVLLPTLSVSIHLL